MKHLSIFVVLALLAALLTGCAAEPEPVVEDSPVIQNDVAAAAVSAELPSSEQYTADIRLADGAANITGRGAAVKDGVLRITEAGIYRLAGEWDGGVVVDCAGDAELVLCGLRLRGEGFALYAKSCDSLTLTTDAAFGQNYFSETYTEADGGIALECDAPLTLRGDGWLTLQSAGNGLKVKDDFGLESGNLTVNAAGFGIKADTVALAGGSTTVDADGDALKGDAILLSSGSFDLTAGDEGMDAASVTVAGGELTLNTQGNAVKADTLCFSGGTGNIYSAQDALQTTVDLTIAGGDWTIKTANGAGMAYYHIDTGGFGPGFGGGSSTTYSLPEYSCKALKSDASIHLTGGKIVLDSEDDAVHGATDVVIDGAELYVRSNDDGIHCDKNLTVESGYILISSCFEGLEAEIITYNGGYADIYSANDGINTSSSTGGFGWSDSAFYMNGGECHVYVFGSSNIGDGVDSNGAIVISGGYITSSTSGYTQENGMDSGSSFVVNGGIVASGGNSGMQESASSYSTQCTAVLSLSSVVSAGTDCVVTDENGTVILTFTPYRDANSLVFSHPDFQIGKTYTVTAGSYTQDFTFESTSYSNRSGHGFGGGRPF